jgi:cell division transport system permease protein
MSVWLNQHQLPLKLVLARMRRNLIGTFMMFCVIGLTLCLPATLYTVVDNLSQLTGKFESKPQISLFLKLSSNQTAEIQSLLKRHPNIQSFQFVSKESAWKKMQLEETTSASTALLESNPLPDAFYITPKNISPDQMLELQAELQKLPDVELSQVDANWVKKLDTMLKLGKKAVVTLTILLGLALIAIIGNTIRLQILTQREEIEVSKLIGATNRFIRRPFLYAGIIYGMGGGLVALMLLALITQLFNLSINEIADLYASQFKLQLPNQVSMVILLAVAITLGWLGSYFAVNRSLAQFEKF